MIYSKKRSTYQIRIILRGLRPPIWRVLQVASDTRLADFNTVLQVAMGWSNIHLHQFEWQGMRYGIPDPDAPDDTCRESDFCLDELLLEAGDSLVYRYDFGGDWVHRVQLEKVLDFDERLPLPLCLRGRRACPLEDVGGPPGYKAFLGTFSDPAHPDHAELLAWIEGQFDPEHFDVGKTNDALGQYCR
jgi:Plasmid pRiA4b ORF-3-like protein